MLILQELDNFIFFSDKSIDVYMDTFNDFPGLRIYLWVYNFKILFYFSLFKFFPSPSSFPVVLWYFFYVLSFALYSSMYSFDLSSWFRCTKLLIGLFSNRREVEVLISNPPLGFYVCSFDWFLLYSLSFLWEACDFCSSIVAYLFNMIL